MDLFFQALVNVFDPMTFLLVVIGLTLGMIIGALPGLTATMGVALLLPLTFGLDTLAGLMVLIGVYFGSIYGGSISAILLKTPGTPASAVTSLDGFQLAQRGEASRALGISIVSSVAGGLISTLILILVAPQLAQVALKFNAPEYFALACFGLSIIISLSSSSIAKGLLVGMIGILISMIGIDVITGVTRYNFGSVNLLSGVSFIPVLIGVFAFSQALSQFEEIFLGNKDSVKVTVKRVLPRLSDLITVTPTIIRSSLIGTFIGSIPGTGGDISAYIAYNETKRWAKNKENFGKGEIKGVAAPEAANNATTGGAMIPLLTLGIPGDSVTAIILGALVMQGVRPGPALFNEQKELLYSIFSGMIVANLLLLVIAFIGIRFFIKVLSVRKEYLAPAIMILCVVGSFAINNNIFDVGIMLVMGIVGYFLNKFDYPQSPLIIALILGPMAEREFRRSLVLSNGDYSIFFNSPIFLFFMGIALLSLVFPIIKNFMPKKAKGEINE